MILIKTSQGDISILLDEVNTPKTTANFFMAFEFNNYTIFYVFILIKMLYNERNQEHLCYM